MTLPANPGQMLDVPALLDAATGQTEYMRAVSYLAQIRGEIRPQG